MASVLLRGVKALMAGLVLLACELLRLLFPLTPAVFAVAGDALPLLPRLPCELAAPLPAPLCVRSCCFMLSLRVKALPHVGQWTFFSPVCFLPWRAAWPDVVKVSGQAKAAA